jgi:prepilin-type N-terminal cleavage/methylation domain-containing protein
MSQRGFTLVEMIVSLALFAVVATMSVGTVVVLLDGNRDLRGEQATISNVQFALDVMTRDIRTGYDYICDTSTSGVIFGSTHNSMTGTTDCEDGFTNGNANAQHGVSFIVANSSSGVPERMAYYYDRGEAGIFRRIGNGDPESILSESITLNDANFIVTGTSKTDEIQPTVTILLEVEAADGLPFELQTTVTQRFLDIP